MQNKAEISFEEEEENHLKVTIETKRVHMESVQKSAIENYVSLFAKPENREKFADGNPLSAANTQLAVEKWVSRWHAGDPFSALAVFQREEDVFMGHVVLGYGEKHGETELAYIFDKEHWGKGYGKESVHAVVKEFAPELKRKGYRLKYQEDKKEFTAITATSRIDNTASTKILESAGLKKVGENTKWGHRRFNFFATVEEIEMQTKVEANSSSMVLDFGQTAI
jgi:RimJ/RimL family protein N-acetyltransferase